MAPPLLVQRFLVWSRCYLAEPVAEVQGVTFAGHPDFDADRQMSTLDEALTLVSRLDKDTYLRVRENVRVVMVMEKLHKPLAPYGAGFIPGTAPEWQDRRRMAGWLVWTAAYVEATRKATGAAIAAIQAREAREELYRICDLVGDSL